MNRHKTAPSRGRRVIYRRAWCSLAGPAGAIGLASLWLEIGAGSALVLLVGLAILGAFSFWLFEPRDGDVRPDVRTIVLGTSCSLGLLALVGWGYALGPTGIAGGALIAATGWPLRPRRGSTERPCRTPGVPQPSAGPPLEQLSDTPLPAPSALCGLSTPQLCWCWRASYVCLRKSPWPSYLEALAELRRACLDELEHRDPVAFAHWFATARAAGDPARYFCGQSQP